MMVADSRYVIYLKEESSVLALRSILPFLLKSVKLLIPHILRKVCLWHSSSTNVPAEQVDYLSLFIIPIILIVIISLKRTRLSEIFSHTNYLPIKQQ